MLIKAELSLEKVGGTACIKIIPAMFFFHCAPEGRIMKAASCKVLKSHWMALACAALYGNDEIIIGSWAFAGRPRASLAHRGVIIRQLSAPAGFISLIFPSRAPSGPTEHNVIMFLLTGREFFFFFIAFLHFFFFYIGVVTGAAPLEPVNIDSVGE